MYRHPTYTPAATRAMGTRIHAGCRHHGRRRLVSPCSSSRIGERISNNSSAQIRARASPPPARPAPVHSGCGSTGGRGVGAGSGVGVGAEVGADSGVDVCLEMHGDFYKWEYPLKAVQLADHPRVGIVHNCDPREAQDGPIRVSIDKVKDNIRHVHIHDLESGKYPYKEFFGIMKSLGYDGYMSLECGASADPERVIGIYAALFREMAP